MAGASTQFDFERDIREFVLSSLPHPPDARAELEAKSVSSLLITYFNWSGRLVPVRKRRVHKSAELKSKVGDLETSHRHGIRKLESDISRGNDLRPYLSRRVEVGYVPAHRAPKKTKHREDRDLLLYDWGLHHLHLGNGVDDDGTVTRSGPLVFAGFMPHDAYLIDVLPHGSWYVRDVLKIIVRNWPDSGLLLPSLSGIRLATTFTEEEGKSLRDAGVAASAFEYEEKVWMPRDFLTTAGTSGRATRRCNEIMHAVDRMGDLLRSDPNDVLAEFEGRVEFPPDPHWRFFINDDHYGIQEETTLARLILGDIV